MNSVPLTVVFGLPLASVYTVKCIYSVYTVEVNFVGTFVHQNAYLMG